MTVSDLTRLDGFKSVTVTSGEREINGAYIGDLLSWVMGRATADSAWITIMSNANILAVASLADVSCIILAEDVCLEESIVKTAAEKDINVISSQLSAYEIAKRLSNNGI